MRDFFGQREALNPALIAFFAGIAYHYPQEVGKWMQERPAR